MIFINIISTIKEKLIKYDKLLITTINSNIKHNSIIILEIKSKLNITIIIIIIITSVIINYSHN